VALFKQLVRSVIHREDRSSPKLQTHLEVSEDDRGHWTQHFRRFRDEAPPGTAPSHLCRESIAPLLVELHLVFFFHGELTYDRDSVVVEQKKRACIFLGQTLLDIRN
jgi:hypothetical protein